VLFQSTRAYAGFEAKANFCSLIFSVEGKMDRSLILASVRVVSTETRAHGKLVKRGLIGHSKNVELFRRARHERVVSVVSGPRRLSRKGDSSQVLARASAIVFCWCRRQNESERVERGVGLRRAFHCVKARLLTELVCADAVAGMRVGCQKADALRSTAITERVARFAESVAVDAHRIDGNKLRPGKGADTRQYDRSTVRSIRTTAAASSL
jgi:hypothetical protein